MTPSLFDAPALTAPALLESLAMRGAVVSLAGDAGDRRLHVAPRDVLTDDDRANIRRLKPDLIALLESEPVHRWRDDPTGAASAAATPTAPDESPDAAAAMPDARALAVAVASATVGAFIRPTPELLAHWRALSAFVGVPLTSRHIGALARLVAQHPQLDNNDLLDLFAAGLMPDEGDGKPVWIEPETLFDTMHATAKARAHQNEVTT